jgi:hypothetical protein
LIEGDKADGGTYSLGHTDAGIADGQGLGILIRDDVDAEVLARVELAGVRQGLVSDLVQGIGGIGNKLPKEDLLVGVDGVDDQRQKLRDFSLELKSFSRHLGGCCSAQNRGSTRRFEELTQNVSQVSRLFVSFR